MKIIGPALVVVLAGALYVTHSLMPDQALAAEWESLLLLGLLLAGVWLMVEAAKTSGQKSQSQAQADSVKAEVESLRVQVERLRTDLANSESRAKDAVEANKLAVVAAGREEAVNLLALLQQKGRFLDFVMDDVTKYPDAQIGAAARVVHQGCSAVVREYFEIKPLHDGAEGTPLTLAKDYDAHRYRVIGRVKGEPPFSGRVLHRGWLTASVKLPERMDNRLGTDVIAPAEVELS